MLYEYDREVQDQVVEFYKNLLEELESWRPTVDGFTMGFVQKCLECVRRGCYGFFGWIFIELVFLQNPFMPLFCV